MVKEVQPAMQTRRIEVGGRNVAVDCYGSAGPAVLLLHGIPGWRKTWSSVAPLLAQNLQVFAPDLPGFGESDDPVGDFHAKGHSAMLLELMDKLKLTQVHVVGFDFGGPVALHLYRQAPQRIRSMALSNTNLLVDTPIPGPLRLAPIPLLGRLIFNMAMGRMGQQTLWHVAVRNKSAFPKAKYLEYLDWPRGVYWTREIFYASMRDLAGMYKEVQDTLQNLEIPCLVIWGNQDPFFPLKVGEKTAALAKAQLVVVPGSGHFVPEEYPEVFVKALQPDLPPGVQTRDRTNNGECKERCPLERRSWCGL